MLATYTPRRMANMLRGKTSGLIHLLSFLIVVAALLSLGLSVLAKNPILKSFSHLLILEGGIILIIFSLSMSPSLGARDRNEEETEGWTRTLERVSLLKVAFILFFFSLIVSFLIDNL